CTRPCAASRDCSEPAACVAGFDAPGGGLCLVPEGPADEAEGDDAEANSGGSCALRPPSRNKAPLSPWLFGLGILVVMQRRAELRLRRCGNSLRR
ncbi:MAG TPA: hypothetical protein VFZ53_30740, partial [Polyangiaceae bacterium]